ncbi:MAG: dephospho-CoA kinase [Deltaproteobacteria bacterium]|nr:dephospho-CoA kinase [Deltaproteobacteria bacterium]
MPKKSSKKNRVKNNKKSHPPFGEKEFVRSVWKAMREQEKKNPSIALLHKKLSGEMDKTELIGLTGGMASGKSLIASFFKKRKIPVVDADQVAREVVQPETPAWQKIVQTFGPGILKPDKNIDRQGLGQIVFSNESRRKILEEITHPEIFKGIRAKVDQFRKKGFPIIVIDAALLFESGLDCGMKSTILVVTKPSVQLKRLMKRDKLSEADAWNRILSQTGEGQKRERATHVIDNSGTRLATEKQFLKIWRDVGPDHPRRAGHGL